SRSAGHRRLPRGRGRARGARGGGGTVSALLETEDLCVGYGAVTVVSDLDLTVRQGEVVALFGANGAGKSTAIMGLCGLARRTGSVRWLGQDAPKSLFALARGGFALIPE